MTARVQAGVLFLALMAAAGSLSAADREPANFLWEAIDPGRHGFARDLGMLDPERDDYATNLAIIAVNRIANAGATPASLAEARRLIGLALHLSPRNRRAVVANFQLARNVLPEPIEPNYSPEAFSRLLLARGQLLENQDGRENLRVARYFIHLAAILDPKNDDAVYTSELMRIDGGHPDWQALTQPPAAPAGDDN